LKICREQKSLFLTPKLPIPHVRTVGWPGTENAGFLKTALLDKSRVLNSKCPERLADGGGLEKDSCASMQIMGSTLEQFSKMKIMSLG
jgi:hypothetical protein